MSLGHKIVSFTIEQGVFGFCLQLKTILTVCLFRLIVIAI